MTESHYQTSFCYPYLVCRVRLTTKKVKKPSGIAYIILELIKRYHSNSTLFETELYRFGVPKELHHIFAMEMYKLCEQEILHFGGENAFRTNHFGEYYISDFEFTPFGKKVYEDGVIPTNESRNSFVTIYYDIVGGKICTEKPGAMLPCKDTCYAQYEPVLLEDDAVDFEELCNKKRKELKLRDEEAFYEGTIEEQTVALLKKDKALTVSFTGQEIGLKFANPEEETFFLANFNTGMFEQAMLKKKKFRFQGLTPAVREKLPECGKLETVRIPSEPLIQDGVELNIVPGMEKPSEEHETDKRKHPERRKSKKQGNLYFRDDLLREVKAFCPDVYRICFRKEDSLLVIPVVMPFYSEQLRGMVSLQVMCYLSCDAGQVNDILFSYLLNAPYSEENAALLARLSVLYHTDDTMKAYLEKQKDRTPEALQHCAALAELPVNAEWKNYVSETMRDYFLNCCQDVTIDNIKAMHQILQPLQKLLGLNQFRFLQQLTEQIDQNQHREALYHQLELLNYSDESILPVVNLVEDYAQLVLSRSLMTEHEGQTRLSGKFAAFGASFRGLCEMTGIMSHTDYTLSTNLDRESYLSKYQTYQAQFSQIKKYHLYAEKTFQILEEYSRIFTYIQEILVTEQEAWENPGNISREYIQNLMLKGDYRTAVCDLHLRLQYELQMYYDSREDTFDLLKYAEQEQLAEPDVIRVLHQIRITRNNFLHPNGIRTELTASQVHEWTDVLFDFMEGLEDEPDSTN